MGLVVHCLILKYTILRTLTNQNIRDSWQFALWFYSKIRWALRQFNIDNDEKKKINWVNSVSTSRKLFLKLQMTLSRLYIMKNTCLSGESMSMVASQEMNMRSFFYISIYLAFQKRSYRIFLLSLWG